MFCPHASHSVSVGRYACSLSLQDGCIHTHDAVQDASASASDIGRFVIVVPFIFVNRCCCLKSRTSTTRSPPDNRPTRSNFCSRPGANCLPHTQLREHWWPGAQSRHDVDILRIVVCNDKSVILQLLIVGPGAVGWSRSAFLHAIDAIHADFCRAFLTCFLEEPSMAVESSGMQNEKHCKKAGHCLPILRRGTNSINFECSGKQGRCPSRV